MQQIRPAPADRPARLDALWDGLHAEWKSQDSCIEKRISPGVCCLNGCMLGCCCCILVPMICRSTALHEGRLAVLQPARHAVGARLRRQAVHIHQAVEGCHALCFLNCWGARQNMGACSAGGRHLPGLSCTCVPVRPGAILAQFNLGVGCMHIVGLRE